MRMERLAGDSPDFLFVNGEDVFRLRFDDDGVDLYSVLLACRDVAVIQRPDVVKEIESVLRRLQS